MQHIDSLVEQTESHVVILFFLLLFLLFLLLRSLSSSTASSRSSATCSRGTTTSSYTRSNIGDQRLDVNRLQGLGEKTRPVGLNINPSSLQDGGELFRSDCNVIISQDEGGVYTGKFRVRHDDCSSFQGRT